MADEASTGDKAVWALLGAVVGAGAMYVLAKEDVWKPNPVTYVEKTLEAAQRRAEQMSRWDYAEWVGRKAWVEAVSGYDSFLDVVNIEDAKIKVRIRETSEDENGLLHWDGDINLDPYWNVEVLGDEDADEALDLDSTWIDAPSIRIRETNYGFVVEHEPDIPGMPAVRLRPA